MYRLRYTGTLPDSVIAWPVLRTLLITPGETYTIGRASDNTLNLFIAQLPPEHENSKTAVSRRHAHLSLETSGEFFLRDLNTVNGTFVNGVRLRGEVNTRVPLGAELVFGGNSVVDVGESPEVYARKGKIILKSYAFVLERGEAAEAEQAHAHMATTGTLVDHAATVPGAPSPAAGPAPALQPTGGAAASSSSSSSSSASPETVAKLQAASTAKGGAHRSGVSRADGADACFAGASASATTAPPFPLGRPPLGGSTSRGGEGAAESGTGSDEDDATEMDAEESRSAGAAPLRALHAGAVAAAAAGEGAGAGAAAAASAAAASPLKRRKSSGEYRALRARLTTFSQRLGEVQAQVMQLNGELQDLLAGLQ